MYGGGGGDYNARLNYNADIYMRVLYNGDIIITITITIIMITWCCEILRANDPPLFERKYFAISVVLLRQTTVFALDARRLSATHPTDNTIIILSSTHYIYIIISCLIVHDIIVYLILYPIITLSRIRYCYIKD